MQPVCKLNQLIIANYNTYSPSDLFKLSTEGSSKVVKLNCRLAYGTRTYIFIDLWTLKHNIDYVISGWFPGSIVGSGFNFDLVQVREKLESLMEIDLREYKQVINEEMMVVMRQMDSPSQIFDYLYLGSEWNASNLEELQNNRCATCYIRCSLFFLEWLVTKCFFKFIIYLCIYLVWWCVNFLLFFDSWSLLLAD